MCRPTGVAPASPFCVARGGRTAPSLPPPPQLVSLKRVEGWPHLRPVPARQLPGRRQPPPGRHTAHCHRRLICDGGLPPPAPRRAGRIGPFGQAVDWLPLPSVTLQIMTGRCFETVWAAGCESFPHDSNHGEVRPTISHAATANLFATSWSSPPETAAVEKW